MKKILIIDDSALMRRVLFDIINSTSEYQVAFTAKNGREGLEILLKNDDIDVVVSDMEMPIMDGLELLHQVKDRGIEVPFVIVSSQDEQARTMEALSLGAIDFVKKPVHSFDKHNTTFQGFVLHAIQSALVSSGHHHVEEEHHVVIPKNIVRTNHSNVSEEQKKNKLIALVCSTGGPRALQSVVPRLPKNIAAPMVLVQHMPKGFTNTLSERLDGLSQVKVKEAQVGDVLENGVVYIAPGGYHTVIKPTATGGRVDFLDVPPVGGLKPCGDIMLTSLKDLPYGEIICVVLTGMGADGTKGIKELADHKNIYVIAQDRESSTVYGMPRSVYQAGLCDCVCDLNDVAKEITKKVGVL